MMTPMEIAGHKIGDKFEIIGKDTDIGDIGDIVTLVWDDGTELPRFENADGDRMFLLAVGSLSNVKPTPKETKPSCGIPAWPSDPAAPSAETEDPVFYKAKIDLWSNVYLTFLENTLKGGFDALSLGTMQDAGEKTANYAVKQVEKSFNQETPL